MPEKPKRLDTTSSRSRGLARFSSKHDGKSNVRALDKSITEALRAILNSRAEEHFRGTTVTELIALRLVGRALKGDIQAVKEIADRTEGRVPQAHAEEPEEAEIKVNIVHVGGEKAYPM